MTPPALRLACTLSLASLPVSLLACGPEEPSGPSLENRTFLSQSVTENGAPLPLVEGIELRLTFYETPRVSASASCNSMSSMYSIEDGAFVLGNLAITAIGCDAERHAQDDWYFGFLGSEPAITIEGDGLVLEGGATRIEYLDQEVATPDAELTASPWIVDTIIDGEIASHAQWPNPAVITFASDGTVTVDTGCNTGSGSYQVSGTELTFSDVAVTERGCDSPAAELEAGVLAVVHGPQPVTWEITVNRLSLRGTNAGLDLVASD